MSHHVSSLFSSPPPHKYSKKKSCEALLSYLPGCHEKKKKKKKVQEILEPFQFSFSCVRRKRAPQFIRKECVEQ